MLSSSVDDRARTLCAHGADRIATASARTPRSQRTVRRTAGADLPVFCARWQQQSSAAKMWCNTERTSSCSTAGMMPRREISFTRALDWTLWAASSAWLALKNTLAICRPFLPRSSDNAR